MAGDVEAKRGLEAAEWLVRLDSPEASQADLDGWAAWCRRDKENFLAYERLESLWREVRLRPARDPELEWVPQSPQHGDRDGGPRARRHFAWSRGPVIAMALLTLALLAMGGYFLPAAHHPRISEQVTSRIAQSFKVDLADGSEITLGGLSAVSVEYSRRQRLIILQSGEVYVRDSNIENWPFVVRAGGLEVLALGTSFDVERSANHVVLSVLDGRVNASLLSRAVGAGRPLTGQQEIVQMGAGERLVVSPNGQVQILRADPVSTTGWLEGRLVYSGAALPDVLAAVNRYSDRPVVVLDPRVAALRFTGTVFLQSIDAWIDSLPSVFPIKVQAGAQRIVLAYRPKS